MAVETLVVTRRSDLSKLKSSKDMFYQEKKDYNEDGVAVDEASSRYVLGTRENLTPHWDRNNNRWAFAGSFEKLLEIAKKIGLREEKTGKLVLPDENSLSNTHDPFFSHIGLWNSTFIEDSSLALNSSNPYHEFYMLVLKGREDVIDSQKDEGEVSKFISDKAKLEIMSPTGAQKVKEANSLEEDTATEAYLSLKTQPEKLERIVGILTDDNTKTQEEMLFFIKEDFVKNDSPNPRFGMTSRKYFLHLYNLDNDTLDVYSTVMRASRMKIINRSTKEGYTFQGEKLESGTITNDQKLLKYFNDDANLSQYSKLVKLVEEKLKLI